MNKRNKGDKRSSTFRSYTDINNYNNFLLELDKTNKESPPVITVSSQKESVKGFIKSVDKEFNSSDYKNQNFTGIRPWESLLASVETNNDPNLYEKNYLKEKEKKKEKN